MYFKVAIARIASPKVGDGRHHSLAQGQARAAVISGREIITRYRASQRYHRLQLYESALQGGFRGYRELSLLRQLVENPLTFITRGTAPCRTFGFGATAHKALFTLYRP